MDFSEPHRNMPMPDEPSTSEQRHLWLSSRMTLEGNDITSSALDTCCPSLTPPWAPSEFTCNWGHLASWGASLCFSAWRFLPVSQEFLASSTGIARCDKKLCPQPIANRNQWVHDHLSVLLWDSSEASTRKFLTGSSARLNPGCLRWWHHLSLALPFLPQIPNSLSSASSDLGSKPAFGGVPKKDCLLCL
jgi:hypothetical protein